MKVYKHLVALLALLLPFTVLSKEVISSDETSGSKLRRKEAPTDTSYLPSPHLRSSSPGVVVSEDFLDKKKLMQTLLPLVAAEKIKKVAKALCKATLDEMLDDTVYGFIIENSSYYCNAEAIGLISGTVTSAFTENLSVTTSKKQDKLGSESGFAVLVDVIFLCMFGC